MRGWVGGGVLIGNFACAKVTRMQSAKTPARGLIAHERVEVPAVGHSLMLAHDQRSTGPRAGYFEVAATCAARHYLVSLWRGTHVLIGRDLSLRIAEPGDAELVAAWYADPEYLGSFYNVRPESPADWKRSFSQDLDVAEKSFMLIEGRDSAEPIGTIGYWKPFTLGLFSAYEIWFQVHPSARGQGVGTRAACLLVNHLFDALPIGRVQATVVVGNEGSRRVAEAAGMLEEGVLRSVFFLHGRLVDLHLYAITREAWVDEATYRAERPEF
jgi:RimJ/RimL family protein N-acetyltransferase